MSRNSHFLPQTLLLCLCALILSSCDDIFVDDSERPAGQAQSNERRNTSRGDLADTDNDGIPDDVEYWIANHHKPFYVFDEQEQTNLADVRFAYQVAPVRQNGIPGALLTIVALYPDDWAETSELAQTSEYWHHGDTESMELFISVTNADWLNGQYRLENILVHRHGDSQLYRSGDFDYLQANKAEGVHPIVYVSQGKHAVYSTAGDCEDHDFFSAWDAGWDEDCDGGGTWFPDLPPSLNVGEYKNPAFLYARDRSELALFGIERIWDPGHPFCGGQRVSDSERYGYTDYGFAESPNCAGALGSKWFPPPDQR